MSDKRVEEIEGILETKFMLVEGVTRDWIEGQEPDEIYFKDIATALASYVEDNYITIEQHEKHLQENKDYYEDEVLKARIEGIRFAKKKAIDCVVKIQYVFKLDDELEQLQAQRKDKT